VGKLEGIDNLGDLDIGRRRLLKWILREIRWNNTDWINLAQDRDKGRALVNTVMKLRVQ
jgi:hypothetical protein